MCSNWVMFTKIKELRVQVSLNTKLIQEGVCTVCLCYGPCAKTGPFTEISHSKPGLLALISDE